MKWLIIIPVIFAALVIGLSLYLQPNDFTGCGQKPVAGTACHKADAIIVVSGGDTESRTTAGIQLYKNGWADSLIFSGAAQDKTGPSNAATMKEQAVAEGVPASAISLDEAAVNTQENAENTQAILKQNGFTDIILVTSGYHQRRVSLVFNRQLTGVTIRNYPVVGGNDWGWFWWLTPRGWWLAGGELVKIAAFYLGITA